MNKFEVIKNYLKNFYSEREYISVFSQIDEFEAEKSNLSKFKVLDATPVFRNTLSKYLPLLKADMELVIGYGNNIPYDPKIVELLNSWGFKTQKNGALTADKFDFVLDCGGVNAHLEAKYGYVELTRSGFYKYEKKAGNVFLADSSLIKTIETALGTGDGFMRAMQHLGHKDFKDKTIMIFGFGKVGFGICMYCYQLGARVIVVDDLKRVTIPAKFQAIDRFDLEKINQSVEEAWCVVSVTGIADGLSCTIDMERLANSGAIVVNMGIENEFGSKLASERILNNNQPLNFILEEPTHLKFIDPTMALDNYGILELLKVHKLSDQKIIPSDELNNKILSIVKAQGVINDDLKLLIGDDK